MAAPLFIGTVAVVLMFQANLLIALFRDLQLAHVPAGAIMQLILYRTPGFLSMTLPVGMALASSLAISRLTRESELTAIRSAGVPIMRVVAPILLIGAVVGAANFWLVERVMPAGEQAARRLSNEIGLIALNPQFRSNVVLSLQNYTAMIGTVHRGQGDQVLLNDIILLERRAFGEAVLITAPSGLYEDGEWRIDRPLVRVLQGDRLLSARTEESMPIRERISVPDLFISPTPQEQTRADLRKAIDEARRNKRDSTALEIAYHVKFSVPAACFVFALTGPVFAVWLARRGPFVGVLLSLILVMLYWNAFVISTEILGRHGWLSPVMAAWLPNVLFFGLGMLALRRAE
jgi:lipopolysaccharide export system permease protein